MAQQLQHQVQVPGDEVAVTEDHAGHVGPFFTQYADHLQPLPADPAPVEGNWGTGSAAGPGPRP